jgi:hypothetical protein
MNLLQGKDADPTPSWTSTQSCCLLSAEATTAPAIMLIELFVTYQYFAQVLN